MTLIFNDYVYGKQTEKCVFERKQYFIPKGLCVIVMIWVYLICFGGGGGGGGCSFLFQTHILPHNKHNMNDNIYYILPSIIYHYNI